MARPAYILLVDIQGQELSHLGFYRLGNQLLSPSPNQRGQSIARPSIFLFWFGTLLHRGVSPLWLNVDVSQHPFQPETPRVFNSLQTLLSSIA